MNQISQELKEEILQDSKRINIIAELQDIQGFLENSELIERLGKVIKEMQNGKF